MLSSSVKTSDCVSALIKAKCCLFLLPGLLLPGLVMVFLFSGFLLSPYLGLTFHAKHGLLSSCVSRGQQMWGAWAALQRKYAGLDCGVSLGLLAYLHRACIPPVASYGCELWGLRDMPLRLAASRRKLSTGHVNMLRQISGLRKSTPPEVVFLETMGVPLPDWWLLRTVTFWNNLSSLPDTYVFKRVALDSISHALHGARNWASSFARALVAVGHPFRPWSGYA